VVDEEAAVSAPATAAKTTPVWVRIALLGVAYFVIGMVTAALARGSHAAVAAWRLTAWALSAVVYAAQIWFEVRRSGAAPVGSAVRAAAAVALGGFLLAVAATVHALSLGRARVGPQLVALVAWPVLLAIPAFLVALAAAAVLRPRRTA